MKIALHTISLVTIIFILLPLCGCTQHSHTFSDADCTRPSVCECGEEKESSLGHTTDIGVCARCGETQNEEKLSALNNLFSQIMGIGTDLFACINRIDDADTETQYELFLEADSYVETMQSMYTEILEICDNVDGLYRIAYQIQLLENLCPSKTSDSSPTNLANQSTLYQLYLQQISSSFSYMSEDLAYFAGTGDEPMPISFYSEVPEMPTPDTIIYGISYDSEKIDSGVVQYTYRLGNDETDANMNYNLYLTAIGMDNSLKVKITDSYVIVEKNNTMVSAMMAGTDTVKGYFLTVTFQQ